MKISRENYEIWFTDWMDNSLSQSRVEELENFLLRNPDLQQEFNEISIFRLIPENEVFRMKPSLRRDLNDISREQFELLCAADAEDDLHDNQKQEFNEMLNNDPARREIRELFGKLKLAAPAVIYRNKRKLIKETPERKAVRLTFVFLAAAAVFVGIVLTGVKMLKKQYVPEMRTSQISQSIRPSISNFRVNRERTDASNLKINHSQGLAKRQIITRERQGSILPVKELAAMDSLRKIKNENPGIEEIHFAPALMVAETIPSDNLNSNGKKTLVYPEESKSFIGKFFARTIREKVLHEKVVSESPLHGYEIAEAGITGLNKLLGWQMALNVRNDEYGNARSVSFTSRMLKFNAPVKRNTAVQ